MGNEINRLLAAVDKLEDIELVRIVLSVLELKKNEKTQNCS